MQGIEGDLHPFLGQGPQRGGIAALVLGIGFDRRLQAFEIVLRFDFAQMAGGPLNRKTQRLLWHQVVRQ